MTKEELTMTGFEIVAYSGEARSTMLEALKQARNGRFENIDALLSQADESLHKAHASQTQILALEAGGEAMDMGFIFIHGQDHLMTSVLLRDLIEDLVRLYRNR